ncbi:MAG: methyltransferase domain-containing protein [Acidobacteria bacterium]|nr:methyltransferase domain-containing protein [Acidobacteriota bacterium]
MPNEGFKSGWMSVDSDADPYHYVRLMDMIRGGREDDPAQYRAVFDALEVAAGERVLDVGCGTGGGVRALATRFPEAGRVVGVDKSETMVAEARARTTPSGGAPVEFHTADAHRLPFPDASFDAAYSLRVFEIIGDPRGALAEMARVLRPGGRVVVNAPDVDAWTIDATDREVTRKVLHHACDFETNGWVGRQLAGWCKGLGLVDIRVAPVGLCITEFEPVYDLCLRVFAERAVAAGAVTRARVERWVEDLRERDRKGLFFSSQMLFRVSARKP